METTYFGFIATILYLFGGLLSFTATLRNASQKRHWRLALILPILLAFGLHGIGLFFIVITPDGLVASFFNSLSVAAWFTIALTLALSMKQPIHSLGIILFPATAICIALGLLFPAAGSTLSTQYNVHLHILFSVIAYALLFVAALQAILLAYQDYSLHEHKLNHFVRGLPPLASMESLLFHIINVGFIFLTLSLLSGFVYLDDMFAQHLVHKTVLSILAWIIFATLLVGRKIYGWRGRSAVKWTVGGFSLLLLAYFGSKMVLELILKR